MQRPTRIPSRERRTLDVGEIMKHRSVCLRLAAVALAASVSLLAMSGQAVVADPAGVGPPVPAVTPSAPAPAAAETPPSSRGQATTPAPLAGPDLRDPSRLPPINVDNVNMTGEAYVVLQDRNAPESSLVGHFPYATTEASKDRASAFGSFADPGVPARSMAPTSAECAFPKTAQAPDQQTRGQEEAGPSAAAFCQAGGGRALGYLVRPPAQGAPAGINLVSAAASAAAVETVSNSAGYTAANSVSTLEEVTLANRVAIKSITNQVSLATSGRPGGAKAETRSTLGGLWIGDEPVQLPTDSLQELGPVLAGLAPVLSPIGTITFDVIPEQKEATADGTAASGQAAQLRVTVKNGQTTTSFVLGSASARSRTVVSPYRPRIPTTRYPFGGVQPPLRYGTGYSASIGRFAANIRAGRGFRPPPGGFVPSSPGRSAGPNEGALNFQPPPGGGLVQPLAETSEPYGGSGPWLALMAASVIGLALVRYLAYARAGAGASP
jgi:hypothetical protein